MTIEQQLDEELLSLYRRTGEATGYWPNYFRRAVRNRGGLAVARKLLKPGQVSSGFDRLAAVRRADLSLEAIVQEEPFTALFTPEELSEARRRLAILPPSAFPEPISDSNRSPEEVVDGKTYSEGSTQRVLVNRYERSPTARAACIDHHGCTCSVCDMDFEKVYGPLGEGFITVHHKRPLGQLKSRYKVDPKKDLVPVCPNCHAMLHRREPPLDVEQLRRLLHRPM